MNEHLRAILENLEQQSVDNVTRRTRDLGQGPQTVEEVHDRTDFRNGGYPEKDRELRRNGPQLPCNHQLDTREHDFGGWCGGRRWGRTCGRAFCKSCAARCRRCTTILGLGCCTRPYHPNGERAVIVCRHCRLVLRLQALCAAIFAFILQPFLGQPDEAPPGGMVTESNGRHTSEPNDE